MIRLDTIDSTNNYAMRLIDADSAPPGTMVVSRTQTAGKGQRGKSWWDQPGSSLLISLIVTPAFPLSSSFAFSASVALGVADLLRAQPVDWDIRIKWPNDILVNDRKAGGLLIENQIKGRNWVWAVVGLGLNVCQDQMVPDLPHSTSLNREGTNFKDPGELIIPLRQAWENRLAHPLSSPQILADYHHLLFRKDKYQRFAQGDNIWDARVVGVNPEGQIGLEREGKTGWYAHGSLEWVW